MDSIVEENGNSSNNIDDRTRDIMQQQQQQQQQQVMAAQQQQQQQNSNNTGGGNATLAPSMPQSATASVLTSTANIVQYLPAATHGLQQSVIQANQSSVIQSAVTNSLPKGAAPSSGVLYMSKPTATVIHTTSGNAVQIKPEPPAQQLDTNSEDSYTDEDSPRRQKDLTRRPSYHKIFNEISGPNISVGTNLHMAESGSVPAITNTSSGGGGGPNASGALIHMPQDSATAFYLPNRIPYNTNNSVVPEDQTRKREIRLQKNREAARECRRKKKEYIKCLENRVAVLENQNKALIEELKSFKELYCQTKND